MLFNHQKINQITRYGIGLVTKAGKYHLVASMDNENVVKRLCISQDIDIHKINGHQFKWFDDKLHAINALRKHSKACHKCMRSIEEEAFKEGWAINFYS